MKIVLSVIGGAVWGLLAALADFFIMKKSVAKNTNAALMGSGMARTAVDLIALGAVFLLRNVLPYDFAVCMIACAVAMSLATIVYTFRLAKK